MPVGARRFLAHASVHPIAPRTNASRLIAGRTQAPRAAGASSVSLSAFALGAVALGTVLAAPALQAQGGGFAYTIAPAYQLWQFAKDVPLDSITVKGATQASLPFAIYLPLGTRLNVSATGAVASSTLTAKNLVGAATTRSLTGITDLRVRGTAKLIGDQVLLTLGLNIPTGTVGLSPQQNDVLRVIAAPAIDAQAPIPGTGFGGTVGLVFARSFGTFAWAAGASVEQRGKYAPFDAQIAGLQAKTELVAGKAVHLSLGTDGLVGTNRLSIGVVGDVYSTDKVRLLSGSTELRSQTYQLGPTLSATALLQIDQTAIRDLTLRLNNRYRASFKDNNGADVAGSSGNYLELGASGLVGKAGKPSLLLGVEVRQHTGLAVDQGFIGAGLTAFGGTLGASIPVGTVEWRPAARIFAGSLKTGKVTTGITGVTLGLTINGR